MHFNHLTALHPIMHIRLLKTSASYALQPLMDSTQLCTSASY